ncbi:hypothetical protein DPMN_001831 [Dreissena polymorpha]|uniref:Uncharacterized protein n=1 Tax=Dreissena polymorpha TaxID=45954 RepID=A0A9D4RQN8_DREPO|nr:hypothetical protein DPMN_001831 [Dreissena polymorpha]
MVKRTAGDNTTPATGRSVPARRAAGVTACDSKRGGASGYHVAEVDRRKGVAFGCQVTPGDSRKGGVRRYVKRASEGWRQSSSRRWERSQRWKLGTIFGQLPSRSFYISYL